MPQNHVGLGCGTPIIPAPLDILESSEDGGEGGRVLWSGFQKRYGHDTGITAILYNFQRGGGYGGASLGYSHGG